MSARAPGFLPERLLSAQAEGERSVADPYRGIVGAAGRREGLFPLLPGTKAPLELTSAAGAYLASLSPAERERGTFPITTDVWRRWSNMHPNLMRHGLCLFELDGVPSARPRWSSFAATMSASGFANARDVMKLNELRRAS